MKKIIYSLTILLIVSITFNIFNQIRISNFVNKKNTFIKDYIELQQGTFYGPVESICLEENLKEDIWTISKVITALQKSSNYYTVAYQIFNGETGSINFVSRLMESYMIELEEYRRKLINKESSKVTSKKMKKLLNDINYIRNWFRERYENNNHNYYTEEEFFKEVFPHLETEDIINNDVFSRFDEFR